MVAIQKQDTDSALTLIITIRDLDFKGRGGTLLGKAICHGNL
jgi:hypothetical protein